VIIIVHFSCLETTSICDWIYKNCSKLRIGSYEIIDFKDFKVLQLARNCEHANKTYMKGRPFHCV